jgi:hypothetical protein
MPRVGGVGRWEMLLGVVLFVSGAGLGWLGYEVRGRGGVWLGRLGFWGLMIPGVLLFARGASRWWRSRNY